MTLTELIEQLKEIQDYCDATGISAHDVVIKTRATDGIKYDVDEIYPPVASRHTVVINAC